MDPRTKLAMAIASVKANGTSASYSDMPSSSAITTLDLPEPPMLLSMEEEQRQVQEKEDREKSDAGEVGEPSARIERSRRTGRKPVPSPEERSTALNSILNYMDSVFQSDFLNRYQGDGENDSGTNQ